MDDVGAGQYIKAICGYMFEDKTPKLKPNIKLHYDLALHLLDLSKKRSETGKKGGNAKRIKVEAKEINARQPEWSKTMGMDRFLQRNPQVRNDLYRNSMHFAEGVDWTYLDKVLPESKYCDCKSLYQILTHYKEIIG